MGNSTLTDSEASLILAEYNRRHLAAVPTFLILGQSNADGVAANSSLSTSLTTFYATPRNTLKCYYKPAVRDTENRVAVGSFTDNGAWYRLDTFHDDATTVTHQTIGNQNQSVNAGTDAYHGVELALAAKYFAANPNGELRIIKVAVAGSTIEDDWGGGGAQVARLAKSMISF